MTINGQKIRQALLDVCKEIEETSGRSSEGYTPASAFLETVKDRLEISRHEDEQALMEAWSDLFRKGVLAWGFNIENSVPPYFRFTAIGRKALSNLSRDPYNPDGYLAVVHPLLANEPVAISYLKEALDTFQAGCVKATGVMVGGAAESLVLSVRDDMVAKMTSLGTAVPSKLKDWKVKTVRDAIVVEVDNRKSQLDLKLYEQFSGFWVSISDYMRIARNDAGHPKSVDPITHDDVHGELLLFPKFAELVKGLKAWIAGTMS